MTVHAAQIATGSMVPSARIRQRERIPWLAKPVTMRFHLGFLRVHSHKLPGLVLNRHFTDWEISSPDEVPGLRDLPEGIDVAVVRGRPIRKALPAISLLPDTIRYTMDQYTRCFIRLSGTFEEYLQNNFSTKTRNTLRRKVRKFKEAAGGAIQWREFSTPSEMREFHDLATAISRKTYQEKLLRKGGLPRDEKFIAGMMRQAEADSVRGFILFLGGKPVSYIYTPVSNGVLDYAYLGYDPEVGYLCPGTVLQYLVLERLFAEGKFWLYDFSEGYAGEQKQLFACDSVFCADIFYFRRNWKNWLLVGSHWTLVVVSDVFNCVLEAVGLKKDIRRVLRRIACAT